MTNIVPLQAASNSPEGATIAALVNQHGQLLITWAVLYQELGPNHSLVIAQQAALDEAKRRLRLTRQEHQVIQTAGSQTPPRSEGTAQ
jgi:hypothetical protein